MTAPDPTEPAARGRLFVVTGIGEAGRAVGVVGHDLASRCERAVVVEGDAFEAMVVSGRHSYAAPPTPEQLRQLLLRWSAAIATAETYQLEGFEAVICDALVAKRLEDFLDLVSPEPVHLFVLVDDEFVPGGDTPPPWGLWLSWNGDAQEAADAALARLEESVIVTA